MASDQTVVRMVSVEAIERMQNACRYLQEAISGFAQEEKPPTLEEEVERMKGGVLQIAQRVEIIESRLAKVESCLSSIAGRVVEVPISGQ